MPALLLPALPPGTVEFKSATPTCESFSSSVVLFRAKSLLTECDGADSLSFPCVLFFMNHLAMLLISAVLVKGQAPNHILSMEEGNLQVFNNGTSTQGWVSNRGIVVYVALFLVSLIFGLCTAYLLKFGYHKFSELKQLQKRRRSNENFISEDRKRLLPKEFPELSIENKMELTPRRKAKLTVEFHLADEEGLSSSHLKSYGTGDEELPLLPDIVPKNSRK